MEYFGESGHLSPFMEKAGYVRCECGGSGWYVGATVADEYHNPMQEQIECPCVANGTPGWSEISDLVALGRESG